MTARDSYRDPCPRRGGRRAAQRSGTQLDARPGRALHQPPRANRSVAFRHGDDADFEPELDLERRIRHYAEPRRALAA